MSLTSMPARFSAFSDAGAGPVSMIAGSEPIEAKERMRARLQPGLLAELPGADQDRGGAVDDARRIAGMVDVVDPLELGIALQADRVEARHRLALHLEAGLERRQGLHRGLRPHRLVMAEQLDAVLVAHGDDRLLEVLAVPGGLGPPLALD